MTMSSQTAINNNNNNEYAKSLYEQVILKVLNADNGNSTAINNGSNNVYTGARRHFVICNSCFWCASLYSDSRTVKCPICNSYGDLESIPISKNRQI
jgi:hypothetical protein